MRQGPSSTSQAQPTAPVSRHRSAQLDSIKCTGLISGKIRLRKLAPAESELGYKGICANFCRRPYLRPYSATAGWMPPCRRPGATFEGGCSLKERSRRQREWPVDGVKGSVGALPRACGG